MRNNLAKWTAGHRELVLVSACNILISATWARIPFSIYYSVWSRPLHITINIYSFTCGKICAHCCLRTTRQHFGQFFPTFAMAIEHQRNSSFFFLCHVIALNSIMYYPLSHYKNTTKSTNRWRDLINFALDKYQMKLHVAWCIKWSLLSIQKRKKNPTWKAYAISAQIEEENLFAFRMRRQIRNGFLVQIHVQRQKIHSNQRSSFWLFKCRMNRKSKRMQHALMRI